MDRVHHLHDQLGPDGPALPLSAPLQNVRRQQPLAPLPPAALFGLGKPVFRGNVRQHLHHRVHSRGPMGGHLPPVQSQATAFPRGGAGQLRRGVGAGAGGGLLNHPPLQGDQADGLPLLPQVLGGRLEPSVNHLPAGVWVPGAGVGGGLLFGSDHLGAEAVGPAQPAEPRLREDHLQQPGRLRASFHPEPPGHPPAVPGASRSDSRLRQQDHDHRVLADRHVPVQRHLLPGRSVLLLHRPRGEEPQADRQVVEDQPEKRHLQHFGGLTADYSSGNRCICTRTAAGPGCEQAMETEKDAALFMRRIGESGGSEGNLVLPQCSSGSFLVVLVQ